MNKYRYFKSYNTNGTNFPYYIYKLDTSVMTISWIYATSCTLDRNTKYNLSYKEFIRDHNQLTNGWELIEISEEELFLELI